MHEGGCKCGSELACVCVSRRQNEKERKRKSAENAVVENSKLYAMFMNIHLPTHMTGIHTQQVKTLVDKCSKQDKKGL